MKTPSDMKRPTPKSNLVQLHDSIEDGSFIPTTESERDLVALIQTRKRLNGRRPHLMYLSSLERDAVWCLRNAEVCARKISYATWDAARIKQLHQAVAGQEMEIYQCKVCNEYHLATKR